VTQKSTDRTGSDIQVIYKPSKLDYTDVVCGVWFAEFITRSLCVQDYKCPCIAVIIYLTWLTV